MAELLKAMLGGRGRRISGRPSPPTPLHEWLAVFAFAALILLMDRESVYPVVRNWTGVVYLVAVVAAACWGGLRAGLISSVLLIAYIWFVSTHPEVSALGRTLHTPRAAIVTTLIFYPLTAVIAGVLQNKLRNAAIREFDLRVSARQESEQRRVAEAELWASEEMRNLIVDSSADAIVGISEDGTITTWNPNAERLFGWTREEAIGSPVGLRIPELHEPGDPVEVLPATFTPGVKPVVQERLEIEVMTKTGGYIAVEVYIAQRETERGRTYILFARDVSERKKAAQAIHELNVKLEERVAERTQQLQYANEQLLGFTYSVSHDLRAPLRSIVSNSRIVCEDAKDLLSEDTFGRLKRLEASALKMADMIDSLLKYARLGQVAVEIKEVDLSEMTEGIASELQHLKPGSVQVQPGMVVHADPDLIRLVMTNLLENAWKYVTPGADPQVQVGTTSDGTYFVRDHGIGFDMKYVDKVWEPFERLHRESEYPGAGIGLANSKRIVERHGGEIWTESAPGEGTTMYFRLASKPKARRPVARVA